MWLYDSIILVVLLGLAYGASKIPQHHYRPFNPDETPSTSEGFSALICLVVAILFGGFCLNISSVVYHLMFQNRWHFAFEVGLGGPLSWLHGLVGVYIGFRIWAYLMLLVMIAIAGEVIYGFVT